MRIRDLEPHEWALIRELRLRALAESPDAFARTLAEALGENDAYWVRLAGPPPSRPPRRCRSSRWHSISERRLMKPLVVLAGPIHADGIKQLEAEARVVVSEELTEAGMIKAAQEASGILFRTKPNCTRSLMAACKSLKVVGRHGVGLDTVDLPAATDLGVAVVHAPGSNSNSVAEHAVMLMLAC